MKKLYTTNFKNKVINLFNYFSILLLKDKFIKTYTRNVLSKYETPPMLINIGAGSFKHPLWINMDFYLIHLRVDQHITLGRFMDSH